MPETVRIRARDGDELVGDLFMPAGLPRAGVLVAPAMGVPRGYYRAFSAFLARQGMAALTVDRGEPACGGVPRHCATGPNTIWRAPSTSSSRVSPARRSSGSVTASAGSSSGCSRTFR